MENLLLKANEIMNLRKEEKEREYGPFIESIKRAASIATEMCDVYVSPATMCKCLIALKLGRLKYNQKDDTILDGIAYLDGLHKIVQKELEDEVILDKAK